MEKIKTLLWLIIIAFMGLIVFQNEAFFMTKQCLVIDLLGKKYSTIPLPIGVFFILSLIAGFFISYLFNLSYRFKSNKKNKELETEIKKHKNSMAELNKEISDLKNKVQETDEHLSEINMQS
mmetsp:Transcript_25325/g.12017  ORF Transcript_25325/g.12017 Transcript_25325/m.12017 type:complete len:122 (+) Transcript_25325:285-650(+)